MGQETRYKNKCLPMASNTLSITGRTVAATINWTDYMHLLQLPYGDIGTLLVGMSSCTKSWEKSVLNSNLYVQGWWFFVGYSSMGYGSTNDVSK